jgi:hypothetical protein
MGNLSLSEICSLERLGLLFVKDDKPQIPDGLVETASSVEMVHEFPHHFVSPTATAAAAWLACMSNNAYGQKVDSLRTPEGGR